MVRSMNRMYKLCMIVWIFEPFFKTFFYVMVENHISISSSFLFTFEIDAVGDVLLLLLVMVYIHLCVSISIWFDFFADIQLVYWVSRTYSANIIASSITTGPVRGGVTL